MKFACAATLVLSLIGSPGWTQEKKLPLEVNQAMRAHEDKMDALQKEIEAKRLATRTELDEILLTQQKAALAAGDAEVAQLIEAERTDIKAVNDRIDLQNALLGNTYRWDGKSTRWTFKSDGTIKASDDKYPWVTLNGNEVLLMMKDGSMRVLSFTEDRSRCRIGFLPPTKAGGNSLTLVR